MAEALLRACAPEGVSVSSAGIGALVGESADPIAAKLMQGRGIDISDHRARQLTLEMVRSADLVLVMEEEHRQYIHAFSPATCGKVHGIGKWMDKDIPDPYKKSPEYFKYVLGLLDKGIAVWSVKLWGWEAGNK